jgi:SMI1 / KNR4 family (SUKH-1)
MQHSSRGTGGPGEAGSRWLSLLNSIRTIQMELKRREPARAIGLSGNPSAPESAIVVAELRLGRKLPPSYRQFLAFSDGWTNFFNGANLLGTGEIGRSASLEASHDRLLARGRLLPFGADRSGASLFAFDTSVRLADGELGVVSWLGGLGIDCRCFTSFLATVLQLCRAELSTVKAADLPLPGAPAARGWLDVG